MNSLNMHDLSLLGISNAPPIDPLKWPDRLDVPSFANAFADSSSFSGPVRAIAPAILRHDPAGAIAFLKSFDANGRHNLWAQLPDTETNAGRTFAPNSWEKITAFVNAHQGWNIYFSVNEPKPDAPHKKLGKENIAAVRAVWGDFDPSRKLEEVGEGKAERARVEALSTMLLADPVAPPSFIVSSGGGYQAFWCLQEKQPADAFERQCEEQNQGIRVRFGGDAVSDSCRILRLPGTINHPNKVKRDRGRVARQAAVIKTTGRRYTFDALSEWTAPVPMGPSTTEAKKPLDIDWGAAREADQYEDLPQELREKFENCCRLRPVLGKLWNGEAPPHGNGSPS
jgi:hypothetical protein